MAYKVMKICNSSIYHYNNANQKINVEEICNPEFFVGMCSSPEFGNSSRMLKVPLLLYKMDDVIASRKGNWYFACVNGMKKNMVK